MLIHKPKNNFTFKKLTVDHLLLLQTWFHKSHVKTVWHHDFDTNDLTQLKQHYIDHADVDAYIACINAVPFAYIQTYIVTDKHVYATWRHPIGKTLGMDLFIGNDSYLGKKLSVPLIHAFIQQYCSDACAVLIDPSATNKQAIHVYHKVGFKTIAEFTPPKQTPGYPDDMYGVKHIMMKMNLH